MMLHEMPGHESPFHCNDIENSLSIIDTECSLYADSLLPRQTPLTSFDKAFTREEGKVYANLSQVSRAISISPTNQLLPNMECRMSPNQVLPNIQSFCKVRDNSLSPTSHCDSNLSSPVSKSPLMTYGGLTPTVRPSWLTKHPLNWSSEDVLDWVLWVAAKYDIDKFVRPEKFQDYTGKDLLSMDASGFMPLSPENYTIFSVSFDQLRKRSNFHFPDGLHDSPLLSSTSEHFLEKSSTHDFDLNMVDQEAMPSATNPAEDTSIIQIDHFNYSYDPTDNFAEVTPQIPKPEPCSDDDYSSGASDRNNVIAHTNDFQRQPPLHNTHYNHVIQPVIPCSVDDSENMMDDDDYDNDYEDDSLTSDQDPNKKKPEGGRPRGRKPGQTTRGNHLWEFVRDLLKDSRYSPSLIKWENRQLGVFRFVQSAAVAKMWGRRKNNQTMNYEKLSRAMRFCRDKKYFASLPKEGKYPKKLCFRFGERAHGWQTDD